MSQPDRFEQLLAEGAAVPVEGWDFSWFEGRATEERPSWGYTATLVGRIGAAAAVLDIQTGGGEVFAEVLTRAGARPPTMAVTESWGPNLEIATRTLAPFGLAVVGAPDDAPLPFPADRFDLIVSRHPTVTVWDEIARTLKPGGTYLSQQIGAGSNRELIDFMMGPQPVSDRHHVDRARAQAERAGLEVVDLRHESLRAVFSDIGAVVHFLRKVVWTVPGFSVDAYRPRLRQLHEDIETHGPFVSHAQRFLIEAHRPV
ncbi:MAG: class I SAM-dependent methyltransferase [Acidimicrobiales bacterium]